MDVDCLRVARRLPVTAAILKGSTNSFFFVYTLTTGSWWRTKTSDLIVEVPKLRLSIGMLGTLNRLHVRLQQAVSQNPATALKQVADQIWRPLGDLPQNLTIVLIPELIGVPFEALPGSQGETLVARHRIRYAFGLFTGVGTLKPVDLSQGIFIVGAERFRNPKFDPLPQSRSEIETLRSIFSKRGLAGAPKGSSAGNGTANLRGVREVQYCSHFHSQRLRRRLPPDRLVGVPRGSAVCCRPCSFAASSGLGRAECLRTFLTSARFF